MGALVAGFCAQGSIAQAEPTQPGVGGQDLFAVVSAGGQLARGTPGTTITHTADSGLYDVHFTRSVVSCAPVANLGYTGDHEAFTFVAAITANAVPGDPHTIAVDVTYPGDIPYPGGYPHAPVLEDNSFHLHVDCHRERYAIVRADGTLAGGSDGITSSHLGTGLYLLGFGTNIRACAPVGTVENAPGRTANADQAHLAFGSDPSTLQVAVNHSWTKPVDRAFSVIVTCTESPIALIPSSNGFFNAAAVPGASACAFTASWINTTPGGPPQDQGYVSTWYSDPNRAGVQTKNGGYGIALGFGVDLVATCPATGTAKVPVIRAVTFTGDSASPTVTFTGHGFGGSPPLGYDNTVNSCGIYPGNGDDYGDQFSFTDDTNAWAAGQGIPPAGNCIGLVVQSWSGHRVVFMFGSAYGSFDHWTADQGDSFTLILEGASFTGTVNYV